MTTTTTAAVDFAARWATLSAERSPLCLGVAPSDKWLRRWHLPPGVDGARAYCDRLLAAAGGTLAAVKVQTPFFTRFGAAGLEVLRRFTDRLHDSGTLVLLDAKVGDADDTMDSYAELYLGPDSVLGGDAVTAQCYMGFPSIGPLLHAAQRIGAVVFVLIRTSNHASGGLQHARCGDTTIAAQLADTVTAWNAEHSPAEPCGPAAAVVGARTPESGALYRKLPSSLVEVPGLGRADRSTPEVLGGARVLAGRALFTVTTGVLAHGPDPDALRASLALWRDTVRAGTS
jgi:orotidine-5'-phosphate decarboxylase